MRNSSWLVATEADLSFFGQINTRSRCESRGKVVITSFENPVGNLFSCGLQIILKVLYVKAAVKSQYLPTIVESEIPHEVSVL